jgi:hypothetical protein
VGVTDPAWYIVTVLGVPVAGPYHGEDDAITECWRLRRETTVAGGSVDLRRFRVVKLLHGKIASLETYLRDPKAKVYRQGEVPDHEAFVAQQEGLCIVVRHEDGTLEVCA